MTGRGRGAGRRGRRGYSLVEVMVALMVLQIGLLGAAGLVVTAARVMADVARTDRALVLAGAVSDSLLASPWAGPGERSLDGLTIRWSASGGWAQVEVRSASGELVLRIPVPTEAS